MEKRGERAYGNVIEDVGSEVYSVYSRLGVDGVGGEAEEIIEG